VDTGAAAESARWALSAACTPAPWALPACLQTCFNASARLIRPGKKASEVSAVLTKIAEAYGCT
jgi:hypothetical protein